jgi:hypothetical protein
MGSGCLGDGARAGQGRCAAGWDQGRWVKAGGVRTVFSGDVINGKKVVSSLHTDDLEPGRKHLLYFQGVQMATGQSSR